MSICKMLDDDRVIESLGVSNGESYIVGSSEVTKIEAYSESGHSSPMIWFAIFAGDQLVRRVSGAFVEVVGYTTEGKVE